MKASFLSGLFSLTQMRTPGPFMPFRRGYVTSFPPFLLSRFPPLPFPRSRKDVEATFFFFFLFFSPRKERTQPAPPHPLPPFACSNSINEAHNGRGADDPDRSSPPSFLQPYGRKDQLFPFFLFLCQSAFSRGKRYRRGTEMDGESVIPFFFSSSLLASAFFL